MAPPAYFSIPAIHCDSSPDLIIFDNALNTGVPTTQDDRQGAAPVPSDHDLINFDVCIVVIEPAADHDDANTADDCKIGGPTCTDLLTCYCHHVMTTQRDTRSTTELETSRDTIKKIDPPTDQLLSPEFVEEILRRCKDFELQVRKDWEEHAKETQAWRHEFRKQQEEDAKEFQAWMYQYKCKEEVPSERYSCEEEKEKETNQRYDCEKQNEHETETKESCECGKEDETETVIENRVSEECERMNVTTLQAESETKQRRFNREFVTKKRNVMKSMKKRRNSSKIKKRRRNSQIGATKAKMKKYTSSLHRRHTRFKPNLSSLCGPRLSDYLNTEKIIGKSVISSLPIAVSSEIFKKVQLVTYLHPAHARFKKQSTVARYNST